MKDSILHHNPDITAEQLEDMEPEERKAILDELAGRPDLWDDVEKVNFY